jgi:hypothetical protein
MPRIKDTESGLWHTPTASGISPTYEKRAGKGKTRKHPIPNLAAEVMEGVPYQVQVEMRNNPQMWQTPNAMDSLPPRSEEALKKQYDKNRKGRTEHSTLREQVIYPKPQQMWPTPRGSAAMSEKTETVKKRVDKRGFLGAKLEERVAMWPTPKSAKGMHFKLTENMEKLHHKKYLETEVAYRDKPRGGHLNPEWVEWLMGFPIKWTDLKD